MASIGSSLMRLPMVPELYSLVGKSYFVFKKTKTFGKSIGKIHYPGENLTIGTLVIQINN